MAIEVAQIGRAALGDEHVDDLRDGLLEAERRVRAAQRGAEPGPSSTIARQPSAWRAA